MSSIVSPQPRLPPSPVHSEPSTMPFMTPLTSQDRYLSMSVPRAVATPPRLLSPIRLAEPLHRRAFSKSPSPCTSATRRRQPLNHISRSPRRRRRHCARSDCQFESFGPPHGFDHLPWISALESSPDHLSIWDLADLSQIISEEPRCDTMEQASGPGPIRRRKTSLRSNPLGTESPSENTSFLHGTAPFPFCVERAARTPIPHTIVPSQVRFHGLLPVLPDRGSYDGQLPSYAD